MRENIIPIPPESHAPGPTWIDIRSAAAVEVSSEDPEHPLEAALTLDVPNTDGWRAADSGRQVVRIIFDQPRRLSRIELEFHEPLCHRSQEFVLAWSDDGGESFREIVRQQWNFHHDAQTEKEEYVVDLSGVTGLELQIDPDRKQGAAQASLARLRVR